MGTSLDLGSHRVAGETDGVDFVFPIQFGHNLHGEEGCPRYKSVALAP